VPPAELVGKDDGNRSACWSTNGSTALNVCSLGPQTGYKERVAVIGDSHVGSMIPAYVTAANELNWRIDVMGKGGCYWTSADELGFSPALTADCRTWKDKVRSYLADPANEYDAIVATHLEGSPLIGTTPANRKQAEIAGLVDEWKPFADKGVPILAMTDVPAFPTGLIECVEKHGLDARSKCAEQRAKVLPKVDSNVEAADRIPGAVAIDTSSFYCGPKVCRPVIGGVPVFATKGHLSKTYASSVGPLLAPKLKAALKQARAGA